MSKRVQPLMQADGLGTTGVGEPSSVFLSALLKASSLAQLAPLACEYANAHLGTDQLGLHWLLHAAGEAPQREQWTSAPDRAGDALADAVFAAGGETRAVEPDSGRIRLAMPIGGTGANVHAVLVASWAARRHTDAAWLAFIDLLAARVTELLTLAEQRISIRRLEKTSRLQRALYAIADLASGEIEMSEMLPRLHAVVGELMYAENFFIALYDPDLETLRFIYFADACDTRVFGSDEDIPIAGFHGSLTLEVIARGKSLMGDTGQLLAECGIEDEHSQGPDAVDWLGVPMIADGQVRGAVVVQSYDQPHRFNEEDRTLLAFVAQHILTALVRKQAHTELERRVEERTRELTAEVRERQRGEKLQAALYAIADLASGELAMSDMLRRIHAVVGGLMYAENFFIALYSAERETLRFIYFADTQDPGMYDPDVELPTANMTNSLTFALIRHGRAVHGAARDVAESMAVPGGIGLGTPAEDFLGVPMIEDGTVRGAVVVQSYDAAVRYAEEDGALLGYVAKHILTALARKQAQAELERRVADRTRELDEAVTELRAQILERERIEQRLVYENLHDALTGLPNRTFLLDALTRAIARLRRDTHHQFAVLFLDLDRFKVINDSVGHLVGDEMLKQAGARLSACVREPDVVSRLGGDEFALLLEDIRGPEDAFHVAQRVLSALAEPMRIAGKELFPSASIGIALSHERYHSAQELLRDADVAMYRAKAHGRHRFEVFDERLHQEALRLLDLEGDLRRAILRSEFEPHYQSIVRLRDGCAVGCEALLRWRHPQRGLLAPGDFIAVAEESGSVEQIDWQLFQKTCREIPALVRDVGYVTLNVSARHFRSPELAPRLLQLLASHDVDAACVRLEVTEGALLDNPDQVRATLLELRNAGVLAVLDDFGTGYSSLSYLHRFPLHALKIDRSFVAELGDEQANNSAAVVRAVLALATTLGMEVVAEGVETAAQRAALLELGCELAQGFLFSAPMPSAQWLQRGAMEPHDAQD